MHEFSLVDGLLRQVESLRQTHGMDRVLSIQVQVGELAAIQPELFRSAFAFLAPASSARGAELRLTEVSLEARCRLCGNQFQVERFRFRCPGCGGQDVAVVQGEAVILQSVTFEKKEEVTAGPPTRPFITSSEEGAP